MLIRAISVGLAVGLVLTAAACGSGSDDDLAGTQAEDRAGNAEGCLRRGTGERLSSDRQGGDPLRVAA
jgi:hypothetical protein